MIAFLIDVKSGKLKKQLVSPEPQIAQRSAAHHQANVPVEWHSRTELLHSIVSVNNELSLINQTAFELRRKLQLASRVAALDDVGDVRDLRAQLDDWNQRLTDARRRHDANRLAERALVDAAPVAGGDGARRAVAGDWSHVVPVDAERKRRLIFTISSGRTGTKLLSQILDSAVDVKCYHERHPLMSHKYLRLPYDETYHERMAMKVGAIRGAMQEWRFPEKAAYCDTSNYFIKSWWDVTMDAFAAEHPITIIVLRRYLPAVLKSMVDLSWFGDTGRECGKFLYSVNSNISFVKPLAVDEELDRFEKAMGHLFDVEAKAQFFEKRYAAHPNVNIHHVCLEQILNDPVLFLQSIGLQPSAASHTVLETAESNSRDSKKKRVHTPVEECENRLRLFVEEYRKRGEWLPTAPQMDQDFCKR